MDPTSIPPLGDTYGAMFIGLLISTVLFGVTNVQAYMFFHANPRDPIGHKISVAWLWLVNFLYIILISHNLYSNLISEPSTSVPFGWDVKAFIFIEILITSTVQFLYVLRIWKLTPAKSKILPPVLSFLAVVNLASELLGFAKICSIHSFREFPHIKWSLLLASGATCLTDTAISASLIYILAQNHMGFNTWADSTVTVLYSYALNSGIIASLLSLASFIPLSQVNTSLNFEGIRIVLSTVHVNSFIAMLNARYYFQPNSPTMLVLQAHETSINISKFGNVHATSLNPRHHERLPTINDAGLPLFKKESSQSGGDLPKVLEVTVAKEEQSRSM